MADTKTTNVYYYQLFSSDENLKPEEKDALLTTVDTTIFKEKDGFAKVLHSDGHVNIHDIEVEHHRYVFGTFVYNQTSNIPPSYDASKNQPAQLQIGDFAGLGYDSSFIYDRKTRILGLESKKPGATPKSVLEFLAKNFKLSDITFKDVVLPDEYAKFLNASEYTRVVLDLAIPNNAMGIVHPKEKNAERLLEVMQDLKGMNAKIVISNGRSKKNKLLAKQVRQLVQWFYKTDNGEDVAKNIRVTGVDVDSEQTHVFNLVSNRLVTTLTINKTRIIGHFQIKSKYTQLKGNFLAYREQLELLQL